MDVSEWMQRFSMQNVAQDALDIFVDGLTGTVTESAVFQENEDTWVALVRWV